MAPLFEISLGPARRSGAAHTHRRPQMVVILHEPAQEGREPTLERLDLDSLDRLMARQPPITLAVDILAETHTAEVPLREIEDFDPGQIARQFQLLATLIELSRELRVRSGVPSARRRLAKLLNIKMPEIKRHDPDVPATQTSTQATEFSKLLEATAASASTGRMRQGATQVTHLIRRIVVESAELDAGEDEALSGAVEALYTEALRQVLNDPVLRQKERTWRALHWLVTSFDPAEGIVLWLLRADLHTALSNGGAPFDPKMNGIGRMLRSHEQFADTGIAAMVLDFELETAVDVALLANLGEVAQSLGTTVLTAAPRALTTLPQNEPDSREDRGELESAWQELRQSTVAEHIGAAQPRLLLRLPYGRRGESSDLSGFEELPTAPDHQAFLWGNPAYGLALLLGKSYEQSDTWPPDLSRLLELEDMPLAVYDDGSGDAIQPAAEVFIDEQDTDRLRVAGIMAFQSFRNRNAVRLAAFHPIAHSVG